MKKNAIILTAIVTLVFTSLAVAGDFRSGNHQRSGSGRELLDQQDRRDHKNHPPQNAGFLLGQCFHDSMVKEVLTDLTGKTPENLENSRRGGIREILDEAGIDVESFRSAMDAKTVALAEKAVQCGLLTQEQADSIAEKIKNRPERPRMGQDMPQQQ